MNAADASLIDSGDTAWVLAASALVLFMTLPGLALFYGGLVRARNLLSVMMHCFAICCVVSVIWGLVGYSLAFGDGGAVDRRPGQGLPRRSSAARRCRQACPRASSSLFQMTFAIITPALIVGAFAERVKFRLRRCCSARCGCWSSMLPVTHWVWGGGWLAAGGRAWISPAASSSTPRPGVSALVAAIMVGAARRLPAQPARRRTARA